MKNQIYCLYVQRTELNKQIKITMCRFQLYQRKKCSNNQCWPPLEQKADYFSKCHRIAFLTEKKIILIIYLPSILPQDNTFTFFQNFKRETEVLYSNIFIFTNARGTQFLSHIFFCKYFSYNFIASSQSFFLKKLLYIIDCILFQTCYVLYFYY